MKNFYLETLACISFCMPVSAQTEVIDEGLEDDEEEVCLDCDIYIKDNGSVIGHRTPPKIPTVYYCRSANKLTFAEPIGDCIIELVDTATEGIVFDLPVMYGVTQIQLPLLASDRYQLKIIRSIYVFSGVIDV